jgi:hypothetical protein
MVVAVAGDLPILQFDFSDLQAGPFEFNALLVQSCRVDTDFPAGMNMVEYKRPVTRQRDAGMRSPIAVIRTFASFVKNQAVASVFDSVV